MAGDVNEAIATLLALGPRVLVQKLGAAGVRIHVKQEGGSVEQIDAPGFPVRVTNN